jgi:hypothetical protein
VKTFETVPYTKRGKHRPKFYSMSKCGGQGIEYAGRKTYRVSWSNILMVRVQA